MATVAQELEHEGETTKENTLSQAENSGLTEETETAQTQQQFRGIPEDLTDVVLVVQGKELPVNRAVLAHYSPVFHKMFFSDFKEKGERRVELPDEHYEDMVTFLNVLFPRTPASEELITDENLLQLLVAADKYDTEAVKVRCQDYVGHNLGHYFFNFYNHYTNVVYRKEKYADRYDGNKLKVKRVKVSSTQLPVSKGDISGQTLSKPELLNKLSLFMRACDDYSLPKHKEKIKALLLALCQGLKDISSAAHYSSLSPTMKVELLEAMCSRMDPATKALAATQDAEISDSDDSL